MFILNSSHSLAHSYCVPNLEMARGDDKCICHALQDFLRNERVPYDRRWLQDPSLPLLQSSDTGIVNCVAWFGASFNPVHEAHLEIAATVQRASPAIMAHLCMNFAGVLIGCSSFEDLTRKAGQQNKAHITADVTALPSRDRFELWHRGIAPTSCKHQRVTFATVR